MKPLFLILTKENFIEIESGKKKIEYREICPFWEKRIEKNFFDHITFQFGYSKKCRITKKFKYFDKKNGMYRLFFE
jgi:hypothetical protein